MTIITTAIIHHVMAIILHISATQLLLLAPLKSPAASASLACSKDSKDELLVIINTYS